MPEKFVNRTSGIWHLTKVTLYNKTYCCLGEIIFLSCITAAFRICKIIINHLPRQLFSRTDDSGTIVISSSSRSTHPHKHSSAPPAIQRVLLF
jgi:hypothetical protein